ncbi:MAG: phage baseplate assembly protein V [Kiritimatiellales bacterium]
MSKHEKHFQLSDALRRIANVVQVGTVESVDTKNARARVKLGEITTAPLPWCTPRQGKKRVWNPLTAGEQVLVVSHNGDPAQGIIVASLGSTKNPAGDNSEDIFKVIYADGSFVQFDLGTSEMQIECKGPASVRAKSLTAIADESAEIIAGARCELTAPETTVTGNVTFAGAVIFSGNVTIAGSLNVGGLTTLATATVSGTPLMPGGDSF